ncbi:hypothetical protein JD844_010254 [Phrynosoma platyrhinos]|uniref:Alpha-2-macroglobulin bait region domain-containing protein n=1 Tax=Phrynosoma platyrhinos TaxID=52577 RepID=A0ABQ7TGZ9_PHRPL|nr:hypothetical protein JD844_010254 [Phrynosoma platyrhinos]
MGHGLERLDKNVIVEFETPDGIVVSQNIIDPASQITQSYNVPETVSVGIWNVVGRYQDSPQETFKTPFEVKEYVLPSFEVAIELAEKFYYVDTNEDFIVSITARYLYGKKVEGVAFVLFGVKLDDEKKSIPDSLRRIQIVDGEGEAALTKAMLQTRFRNTNELIGHSLYISVTVMTESGKLYVSFYGQFSPEAFFHGQAYVEMFPEDKGSDMVVAEKGGISIVTSPYQLHFTKTPVFFKPGMPYGLMVYVTNPDGSPATQVPVVSEEPLQAEATTQNDGTAKLILNTPGDSNELRITLSFSLLLKCDNEEFIMDEDDIVSRTEFPESWLWETKVRVELIHNPAFCSASTAKERYRQDIIIKDQSSTAVPFVLVPLQLGLHDIEVKAAVWQVMMSDGVKKKLRVVPEGMPRILTNVIQLDPDVKGKRDPVAQIVEDSIDGSNLKHLIITPSGCAEQNMITMTPSVIATHYLDATEQWEKVGVDRRSEAIKQIMQGQRSEVEERSKKGDGGKQRTQTEERELRAGEGGQKKMQMVKKSSSQMKESAEEKEPEKLHTGRCPPPVLSGRTNKDRTKIQDQRSADRRRRMDGGGGDRGVTTTKS